jgi:nitrite reductase/ring-hydroxylating ferredoxin subunit
MATSSFRFSCPWHGWEFALDTGETLFAGRQRLNTFEISVDDGTIIVDI